MSSKIMLSFDVEDWFCVTNMLGAGLSWPDREQRIHIGTEYILGQLRQRGIRATFFVLGWIADHHPALIESIANEGHELGSHGYTHTPLQYLTPDAFEDDLCRSIHAIQRATGQTVRSFRAPCFSITDRTRWALSVLERNGLEYDSSIFPTKHPEYGIPDFGTSIRKLGNLWEVPLTSLSKAGTQIPLAGGGYFRLFPYWLTKRLIHQAQDHGPVVLYFHPWEFDPEQPRIALPLIKKWRHYQGLENNREKFEQLLDDFEFCSIADHLQLFRSTTANIKT